MAADFKLKDGEVVRTVRAVKASATVIEAGDLVEISSGLIIKATATGAAVAFCPAGAANGSTIAEVTVGNDFTLVGTGDAAFAVTDKGALRDLVVNGGAQQIDIGTTSTNVLKVGIGSDSGTASSAANIEVKINKPIF